jgi:hypothetical protein
MSIATPSEVKPHRATEHPPFERITLLLQGGGALVSGPVPPPPREREAGFDWRCDVVDVGIDLGLRGPPPKEPRRVEIHLARRKQMLISFSTLVLASQLIVPVADSIPKFNIERGCKVDSTSTDLSLGLDETIKRCVQDEKKALDLLQSQWSQFAPPDRVMCISAATNTEGAGVPPSYVDLLTCLEGQFLAKK